MRIDLHVHSSVSDGTDSPALLVTKAKAAGLAAIGLCDHDTFDGIEEGIAVGRSVGVSVLPGLEMSCKEADLSVHLLGYGCDPQDEQLTGELSRIREGRSGRLSGMVKKLNGLGLVLTTDDVLAAASGTPSVGRPHVADALIARGYAADRNEAFARWLGDGRPAYVPRYAAGLDRAIDLIHGAGGVAVIAHPWGRGGDRALPAERLACLVHDHGLDGIEVDHEEHSVEQRRLLSEIAEHLGLLRTGASDYHGRGKKGHGLGVNTTSEAVYQKILARIQTGRGYLPE